MLQVVMIYARSTGNGSAHPHSNLRCYDQGTALARNGCGLKSGGLTRVISWLK